MLNRPKFETLHGFDSKLFDDVKFLEGGGLVARLAVAAIMAVGFAKCDLEADGTLMAVGLAL